MSISMFCSPGKTTQYCYMRKISSVHQNLSPKLHTLQAGPLLGHMKAVRPGPGASRAGCSADSLHFLTRFLQLPYLPEAQN